MLMQLPRDRAGFMHFIAILKQGTSTNMIVRIWTDLEKILVEGIWWLCNSESKLCGSHLILIFVPDWKEAAGEKSWNGERLTYKTEEKWTSDLKQQTEQT